LAIRVKVRQDRSATLTSAGPRDLSSSNCKPYTEYTSQKPMKGRGRPIDRADHLLQSRRLIDRRDFLPMSALALLWILLIVVVDPQGEFPLVDDWSYARSVKTLLEENRLEYDGWNNPTLFFQVLYGALFCLPFGFSFEALRYSTLAAGLIGGLSTYLLLRQISPDRSIATLGSLTLILNPVYFQYAFTFMTDVPFTAAAVVSALFLLNSLQYQSRKGLIIGTAFACAATLIRQVGIAITSGYALALLVKEGFRPRGLVWGATSVLATVSALGLYNQAIDLHGLTPALSGAIQTIILVRLETYGPLLLIGDALKVGIWLLAYLALFTLPWLLLLSQHVLSSQLETRTLRIVVAVVCGVVFFLLLWRTLPPYQPLSVFKLAPMGMVGARAWGSVDEPVVFRQTLSAMAVVATTLMYFLAIIMVVRVLRGRDLLPRPLLATVCFGIGTPAVMLAPALVSGFMERYLIPAIPFLLLALVALLNNADARPLWSKNPLVFAALLAVLALQGGLSTAYAHDLLKWNRARWDAVSHLIGERNVPAALIDGGLAVNGWYLFTSNPQMRKQFVNWQSPETTFPGQPFWRNMTATYLVCFERCDNICLESSKDPLVLWKKEYTSWLPGADGAIVICEVRIKKAS
jgi:Dolichyl-phosphate-mannose-protein mannosyltransferase